VGHILLARSPLLAKRAAGVVSKKRAEPGDPARPRALRPRGIARSRRMN
jgi:hypothetical protein